MDRRRFLTGLCSAGAIVMPGCATVSGERTLSEPTVRKDSAGRQTLVFKQGGDELGHFGVDGRVDSGVIDLSSEIWHREGTRVTAIELRLWMPEMEQSPAEVAVVSPVEGDSSPPPAVALYTPDRKPGTTIAITDLDDLADETISTLELNVEPGSETATALAIHATIELTENKLLGREYTADGELRLEYPILADGKNGGHNRGKSS
ncbi:hypothetical protein [Halorhabdus rudnickae]|uniref:hypothetical protein n=1 Tax=Halorhabdus rudnickae TaxID=1775544 RepID=UPI001FCEFB15|nr:hypothetical protein [Halorhabdus rudnickae]